MPARPPHFVAHPGPVRHLPPPTVHPPAAVQRQVTVATRTDAQGPAPDASVYQPWQRLLAKADTRYKAEMTAALRDLEQRSSEAGTLLDTAYSMAAEAAGHLESAAWMAWRKWMAAADDTRNSILGPATTAYDEAVSAAHAAYDAAMSDAEKTYASIIADAKRAQDDTGAITA